MTVKPRLLFTWSVIVTMLLVLSAPAGAHTGGRGPTSGANHFVGAEAPQALGVARSSSAFRAVKKALYGDGFRVVDGAFMSGELSPGRYDVLFGLRGRQGAKAIVHVFVDVSHRSVSRVVTEQVSGADARGNHTVVVDDGSTLVTAIVSSSGQELRRSVEHYGLTPMLTDSQECTLGTGLIGVWQCFVWGLLSPLVGLGCGVVWVIGSVWICG